MKPFENMFPLVMMVSVTFADSLVSYGAVRFQNSTTSQKDNRGTASQKDNGESVKSKNEENKGEVDLLLEELKKHNDPVLGQCLEKCPEQKESNISVGQIVNKVQPDYPALARAAHASGEVVVMIVIGEDGKVKAAQVYSGHPLLHATCLKAARESTFSPTLLENKPVKVLGTISYKFVSQ